MRNRKPMAGPTECAPTSSKLTAAAPSAPSRMSVRAGMMSTRLKNADTRAPTTNPTWTAIVRKLAWTVVSVQAVRSCGRTAVAENQVVIASSIAKASRKSA